MTKVTASDTYWAADPATKAVIARLDQAKASWLSESISTGLFSGYVSAYWRNTIAYYSNLLNSQSWESSLEFAGVKGELIKMKIPRARTLIRQFVTLTTKQRLAFEATVDVDDAQPQMTAKIGRQLSKHVVDCEGLDTKQERAAELAATVGMAFYCTSWRSDRGSEYVPNERQMLMRGAPSVSVKDIKDVMWDWTKNEWRDNSWVVVRNKRNRWDLIEQVRAKTDIDEITKDDLCTKIRGLPSAESEKRLWNNLNYIAGLINEDDVNVYTFVHRPTRALDTGRMIDFCSIDVVLDDVFENPYNALPVEPVIFEPVKDTGLGYPLLSSLLPAQEMFDHSFSVTATNQSAFGVQSLLNPRGSKISVEDMNGMKVIHYSPPGAEGGGKPEAMKWPETPPSVMAFAERLGNELGELSMLNATLRGQPPPNVTSGAMAATLSANALEFLNTAQRANSTALEKTMNHVMNAYKHYAQVDQIIDITGEQAMAYSKEISKEMLQGLRKVTFPVTNPMLNYTSGRMQLGEALMEKGLIKDPTLLVNLLNGAPVDTLFKSTWTENMSVQAEVDALLEGRNVFPLLTDNHPLYIAAYKQILDNPIVRETTDLPQIIIPLMKQRVSMEMTLDPVLKAFLRGTPAPEQAPPSNAGGSLAASSAPAQLGAAQPAQPAEPIPMQ